MWLTDWLRRALESAPGTVRRAGQRPGARRPRCRRPRWQRHSPATAFRRMEFLEERTPLAVSVADFTVIESVGTATAMISLSEARAADASVTLSTAFDSATPGSDYVETSQTIVIPAGETSAAVDISIVGDEVAEPREQFFLVLSSSSGVVIDDPQAIVTILDDDGSIGGVKWEDVDGDGAFDAGEPLLEGVTIFIDLDRNGQLDISEPTVITDASGSYEFPGLPPGSYVVGEVVPSGFEQTFPRPTSPPLPDILSDLDASFAEVNALIPNRYDFSEGVTGDRIFDGGNDMFDSGNFLNTNLANGIDYTAGVVTSGDSSFGPGSSYFTQKHPGLFVMSAQDIDITQFEITGGNGVDNSSGVVNGAVLDIANGYTAFVKRVFSTSQPSVNHIILVPGDGDGQSHVFSFDSNDDQHQVIGLDGVNEIHYLLVASTTGGFINDAAIRAIAEEFVQAAGLGTARTSCVWNLVRGPAASTSATARSCRVRSTAPSGVIWTRTVCETLANPVWQIGRSSWTRMGTVPSMPTN